MFQTNKPRNSIKTVAVHSFSVYRWINFQINHLEVNAVFIFVVLGLQHQTRTTSSFFWPLAVFSERRGVCHSRQGCRCLHADEACLMRKDWNNDKFTQGGDGGKTAPDEVSAWLEDIYCLGEWRTELLPYSSLKRNTVEFDPQSCCFGRLLELCGFVSFTAKPEVWKKSAPHPNLPFASSSEDEPILQRSLKGYSQDLKMFSLKINNKILKPTNTRLNERHHCYSISISAVTTGSRLISL